MSALGWPDQPATPRGPGRVGLGWPVRRLFWRGVGAAAPTPTPTPAATEPAGPEALAQGQPDVAEEPAVPQPDVQEAPAAPQPDDAAEPAGDLDLAAADLGSAHGGPPGSDATVTDDPMTDDPMTDDPVTDGPVPDGPAVDVTLADAPGADVTPADAPELALLDESSASDEPVSDTPPAADEPSVSDEPPVSEQTPAPDEQPVSDGPPVSDEPPVPDETLEPDQAPVPAPPVPTPHEVDAASRRIRGLLVDDQAPVEPVLDEAETPIGAAAAAALRRRDVPRDAFPPPARRRVISISNQKGGVGKTTSTVNIAVALALHGAKVLVIDLDPQGNASTGLGVEHHSGVPDVYDVLVNGAAIDEVVRPAPDVEGCWCVPATIDLAGAEIELVSVVAREWRLQRAIEAYCAGAGADLDYVIIDCPPSLGLLTVNAMVAAQEMLIPIQCEYYALEGLGQLLRTVEMVRVHLNPVLVLSTILLTMYDARTRLADQVATEVRGHFGETVLGSTIPRSVRVSEAPGYGKSVVAYDPGSRGAVAYVDAAREIALRGAAAPSQEVQA